MAICQRLTLLSSVFFDKFSIDEALQNGFIGYGSVLSNMRASELQIRRGIKNNSKIIFLIFHENML